MVKPIRRYAVAPSATAVSESSDASDLIDLSTGDVRIDLELPPAIDAGTADDRTYSATAGYTALRQVIASQVHARGWPEPGVENVVVGPGARTVLFATLRALLEPGDEVLVPTPYWPSYPELIRLAGGTPVPLAHAPLASTLSSTSSSARMIIANSPRNPTGSVLGSAEMSEIAEWADAHDAWIVADEVYAALTFAEERAPSVLDVVPEAAPRTVLIDGISKSLAMAGLRLGWSVGPSHVMESVTSIMSHLTANTSNAVQRYALSAITSTGGALRAMKSMLRSNARELSGKLDAIAGIDCPMPAAGLFCFPNVSGAMAALGFDHDDAFASHLAEHARVKVVAGSAFGHPGHVRASFAVDLSIIGEAVRRLAATLGSKVERDSQTVPASDANDRVR